MSLVGFSMGARAGFKWGSCRGAVASALAALQQSPSSSLRDTDVRKIQSLDQAWSKLQDHCSPSVVQKQECAMLWEETGEMKDRFEDSREDMDTLVRIKQKQDDAMQRAKQALGAVGVFLARKSQSGEK